MQHATLFRARNTNPFLAPQRGLRAFRLLALGSMLFGPVALGLMACGSELNQTDAGSIENSEPESLLVFLDAGAEPIDAGAEPIDAGMPEPEPIDAGMPEPEPIDAGMPEPEPIDAGMPEPEPIDAGMPEPEPIDAGMPEPEPEYIERIDHAFLIAHFGGNPVDATAYPDTLSGFQLYLDAVGIQYFSANEITRPNNPTAAANCGYNILLPEQSQWEKAGALAIFSDQLRALVGEPVLMRNWWRPACYNDAVGGAATGDHPPADAVDLDFRSATSRALAQHFLCQEYWLRDIVYPEELAPNSTLNPRLNMSVGLGGVTIHLGVLSANGRRFWKYGSYTTEPNSGTCW